MKYFDRKNEQKYKQAVYKRKTYKWPSCSLNIKQQQIGGIQDKDPSVREGFMKNRWCVATVCFRLRAVKGPRGRPFRTTILLEVRQPFWRQWETPAAPSPQQKAMELHRPLGDQTGSAETHRIWGTEGCQEGSGPYLPCEILVRWISAPLEYLLCHLPATWPWASHFPLCASVSTLVKWAHNSNIYFIELLWECNGLINMKHLKQLVAHTKCPKTLINIWNSILCFTHLQAISEKDTKHIPVPSSLSPRAQLPVKKLNHV